ncbi:MAG: hypothetical protein JWP97_3236 [Labilithrix sp.]|nr:hypothetical protein [Labilithrix sp.]
MPRVRLFAAVCSLLVVAACGSADLPGGASPPPPPPPASDGGETDAGAPEAAVGDAAETDAGPDVDASDGGLPGGEPATVTPGAADRILLNGTVVTGAASFAGQVLVEGTLITCVAPGLGCQGQVGATGATIIDTHGVIAPGLIDTHNHILFDIFDDQDWLPSQTYTNHNAWTAEPRYQAMLDVKQCLEDASQGKPTWCPSTYDGPGSLKCEMDKWGELKGLVAGTTSIVGLAGTTSACFGSVARSIDAVQSGLGQDKVQTSALFPPSKSAADGVCANYTSGKTDAYLIHVGEGTDEAARAEFARLGTASTSAGCLYAGQTTITHGTAFGSAEFTQMAAAGMRLTWSPASNVALYGTTTDIPAALDAGVGIALAPDWSMGGSQNLLDELRFADAWDDAHFGNRLGARELVAMTTTSAAAALGLTGRIGSLVVGGLADLMVVTAASADPYASIVAARPKDVRLTIVGGRVLFGDKALEPAAPTAPGCESITLCGTAKFLCVAEDSAASKLNQTHAMIKAALEAALTDVDAVTPDGYDFAPLAPLVKCN